MTTRVYWALGLSLCLACSELHGGPVTSALVVPAPVAAPTTTVAVTSTPAAPFMAAAESEPSPRPDYEQADLDEANDSVVAPPEPIDDCALRLERAGISFRTAQLPLRVEKRSRERGGDVFSCGAEQVVTYLGGPARIHYDTPPLLTCRLALALGHFEQVAQEQALRLLGHRVVRLKQMGTYSCRKMVRFDFVSEHSYANAIDIKEFRLDNGERVAVNAHFGALDLEPKTPHARFLRSLAVRAFDERLFSVVLTPYWDNLHRDHFHFDLARYRVDGTRAQVSAAAE